MKTRLPLSKHRYLICCLFLCLYSCKPSQNTKVQTILDDLKTTPIVAKPKLIHDKYHVNKDYRASYKRENDLVHTSLRVKFDWAKAHLLGEASITLKPHFYATDKLTLDAKGFDIHKVALINTDTIPLKYEYNQSKLNIQLDKTYSKEETYTVFIKYTSKPNEIKTKGSEAIASAKGLYFINPDGKTPNKPMQIWTQGETEASSCWFPTIDAPNQHTTQEIYITVDNKYTTLSNGKLISSTINTDSTRTDYWKQELPHVPYLFMMTIGEFSRVDDQWKDLPLSYYVEPEYEPYAKAIFGKTPKMIQLYTNLLGVDYVWDKYAQIVVRDYVAGAMENTGAVIFGEFVHRNDRERMDANSERIIAHELFHHWFGDLVTCESWSNLPLNESFANYGEYLWNEAEYGSYEADYNLSESLDRYYTESRRKQVDLIRYYYDEHEDMFDRHSYNKGGGILHMLRKYVGDEAFFKSLNLYLTENKHQSAEIHHLRLAFEKTTGEDLNWFFNQWFLSSGHPILDIKYNYADSSQSLHLTLEQKQDFTKLPVYRLPIKVDIYLENEVLRKQIWLSEPKQNFTFKLSQKPILVNVDADKTLIGEKEEYKSVEEYHTQFESAPLYMDKIEALEVIKSQAKSEKAKATMIKTLSHDFWYLRQYAIKNYSFEGWEEDTTFLVEIMKIALEDPKSQVRAEAVTKLCATKNENAKSVVLKKMRSDSSYLVMNTIMSSMKKVDIKESLKMAEQYEDDNHFLPGIIDIYKDYGDISKIDFFEDKYDKVSTYTQVSILNGYTDFITRFDTTIIDRGSSFLENIARNESSWRIKIYAIRALEKISGFYEERLKKIGLPDDSTDEKNIIYTSYKKRKEIISELIADIINNEEDTRVKKYFK